MRKNGQGPSVGDTFERQAGRFGLALERKSFVTGEHEDLGAFLAAEASSAPAAAAAYRGETDEQAIEKTIKRLETTHPNDAAKLFEDTVTDPFHLFTSQGMKVVTSETLATMQSSPKNQANLADHPPKKPRQVNISGLKVTHLGKNRATATYCTEEECQDGQIHRYNVGAFLSKSSGGWRVVSASHKEG